MSQSVRPVLRLFWHHARRYPFLLSGLIASLFALNVVDVLSPLLYKRLIDTAASTAAPADLAPALLAALTAIIALNGAKWVTFRCAALCNNAFQPRVMVDLERTAFTYILGHSYRFFSNAFAGSLVRKVHRLSRAFESFADQVTWRLLNVVLTTVGMTLVFWSRSPMLAVAMLVWVAIFVLVNYLISRWKLRYDEQRAAIDSEATAVLSDALSNAVIVKQYNGMLHENAMFRAVTERFRRIQTFTWNLGEINDAAQFFLMFLLEGVALYFTIQLYVQGKMTIGDFVLVHTALSFLFDRLWDFGRVIRHLYEAFADAREMVDILEEPHEVADRKGAKKLRVSKGEIVFDHVTFAYNEKRPVLEDFSLRVVPKEKVAFVGPSGAGKSTVTKLLLRLFDVTQGDVRIDGQSIAKVMQESLREQIALVPQDPTLFHRSLMDNIRYGRRGATDKEVIAAAKKAHCDEFIQRLPSGYETLVGERGIKLSGGERQRVAIARAILKNAPILILDEATSSLDSASEALIQDALHGLMRDKTVIVIAHRLSTIMQMDRIVVIEHGRVNDDGTHAELLQRDGAYKKLWSIQAGGFLP